MNYFLAVFLVLFLSCPRSLAEPADPKAYLQMIYENKGGYTLPSDEVSAIYKEGGHPQYGEIPYDSAAHILEDLQLSRQDVFYDLGSGVGKLVLQVYMTTPVKRSIGIELSQTRWNIAEASRKQVAEDDHIIVGRDLGFLNQNILKTALNDATVCFISGITFPPQLTQAIMDRLGSLDHDVKVLSVLPLPAHKQFRLIKTYNLPMSWAPEGVDICLYQVTPASQTESSTQPRKGKRRKRQMAQEED
jgi:hypothetical protein